MKIAITSTGPSLDDMVETRFGRCACFLIIDLDTMELEALPNPNKKTNGEAGIQSAQLLARKNVSVLFTGNCEPNASQTFNAAGIYVMTGLSGQVREAIQKYMYKKLIDVSSPAFVEHSILDDKGRVKEQCSDMGLRNNLQKDDTLIA